MAVTNLAKSWTAIPSHRTSEQLSLSTNIDSGETAVPSDELFTCFIGALPDSGSHSGPVRKEIYQCRCCGKQFGRLDHVKRHSRSRKFLASQRAAEVSSPHQMQMTVHTHASGAQRASTESKRAQNATQASFG